MSSTTSRREPDGGQLSLFNAAESTEPRREERPASSADDPDAAARAYAVDPRHNVVLEASAGTGKTSVLVCRYINLLKAGVEPANILAITFTRKAAAEMRERILRELRESAARSEFDKARWLELRDRLGEIGISTIDAFCLSLLREFPLEADLDPGFEMADETEVPRLVAESLDRSLRIFVRMAKTDRDVALVLAQLGVNRTREGLATLLDRRLVAWDALDRFLTRAPADLTADIVCRRTAVALQDTLRAVPGGLERFLADGPAGHPRYQLFLRQVAALRHPAPLSETEIRTMLERIAAHFLTNEGTPRKAGQLHPYRADHFPSKEASKRHRDAVFQIAPNVERVVFAFNRDLNVVLARGIRKMFAVALDQYRGALDERSVLDFSDVLQRALDLLRHMDEFSQSRFRLEGRHAHVLVDEFQDTSRAQWTLVALLIQAWREGLGVAAQPSIFIVGDRKQSIYRFRDAEVAVLEEAGRYIEGLRPGSTPRRAITRSFRAVPQLLAFVNELFAEIAQPPGRPDDFAYGETDRFPVDPDVHAADPVIGIAVGETPEICAAAVADEILRILKEETVRDKQTGVPRPAAPGDIAILFRSRASHREFEHELEVRGVPVYVYKGLGFFDADEIKDMTALMRYLANPRSDLRAAAFLRSRFVRLSDEALALLAPRLAAALTGNLPADVLASLPDEDRRVLEHARRHVTQWLAEVDRIPPADLLEAILERSAYVYELRGARRQQAWENLKKMRSLVRRIQNRGYATLPRIADHIDALTPGDESNAVLEALDAVNLMTVHASKGLEFPIVFVVNLAKGASGPPRPIRVVATGQGEPSVTVGPFVSEIDEADREREKHETRRLLYVAVTRARDRLYLSSVLKDGAVVPGRGSLAEVLPESIKGLLARAHGAFEEFATLAWSGPSGRSFDVRRCRHSPVPAAAVPDRSPSAIAGDQLDFAPLDSTPQLLRVSVTQSVELTADDCDGQQMDSAPAGSAITGRIVHRLFEAWGTVPPYDDRTSQVAFSQALLRDEERTGSDALGAPAAALDAWHALRIRDDVVRALSGMRRHEVPVSLVAREGGQSTILRGTIDCVVQTPEGTIRVVEFKTGKRRRSHQKQLDIYVDAMRAMFPAAAVEGVLIYS